MSPTVWTTLTLTVGADGSVRGEMTGASRFPRHWIYDHEGHLTAKSGTADLRQWLLTSHGEHTPWGSEDSKPLVTVAETALERQMSAEIMRAGDRPSVRRLAKDSLLVQQGAPGGELYLLLDGILGVWADGRQLGQLGPGAVVGERALIESGRRTATVRTLTDCVVATAKDRIDRASLTRLAELHHREDPGGFPVFPSGAVP